MTSAQLTIVAALVGVAAQMGVLYLFRRAFAALFWEIVSKRVATLEDYTRDMKGISDRVEAANAGSQLAIQMAERATETGERAVQEAKSTRDLLDRLHERIVQDFVEPIQDHGRMLGDVGKALAALTTETKANSDLLGKLLDRELDGAK